GGVPDHRCGPVAELVSLAAAGVGESAARFAFGGLKMDLHIAFLYPDLMNIYGDRGNIIALQRRAEWRGISVAVHNLSIGDALEIERDDFYFFGGGQDRQQIAVSQDLQGRKGAQLKEAVEGGAVIVSVCGGYQLL